MSDTPRKTQDAVFHLDPQTENGVYANSANFLHSPSEFLLDFILLLPGSRRKVVARVITAPAYAKQMAQALTASVARYEAAHGEILLPEPGRPAGGDFSPVQ